MNRDRSYNPEQMAPIVEVTAEVKRKQALERISQTIKLAKIRCLSVQELITRLRGFPNEADESELFYTLRERSLTTEEQSQVEELITYLRSVESTFDRKAIDKLDRRLVWLCELATDAFARDFGFACLTSSRRARRAAGYKVLRRVGVKENLAAALIELFRSSGEQAPLELIARSPEAATAVEPRFVLSSLQDRYWRARFLQCVLSVAPESAYQLAADYPVEFAHAVGRSGERRHVPS